MSSRLRGIATANQAITEVGRYTAPDGTEVEIGTALAAAVAGTRCVDPDEPLAPPHGAGLATVVEVTEEDSLTAARRQAAEGPVAVLNFASARNVGGGYLGGARAQEEDLCRKALLYPCLLQARSSYDAHRASEDLLYSDRVIWSPDVPVHRDGQGALLAEPFAASFLTSPAPNAGALLRRDPSAGPRVRAALERRSGRVLAVASSYGVRQLVLGAWGCGVFRNDPSEVARAFRAWLAPGGAYHGVYERVVFAVWDRAEPSANRAAFRRAFSV
ncbi:TIGR02452 family protein [Streptacidiphilus jiangxiensis]|uniref:TIGR02452 family protein n=1 Tax=Streptacidiphilus jiangxiensis TaxID=235985 RepID=A0A1H7U6L8_STRJI|nr:TIGR02452 family protein [Streptacidiphilus jiangxiensis]SEL92621.1 TIGR02452 family protein [Streptacidiphilus jiangxiensis]